MIFKIYVTNNNHPSSNIDLSSNSTNPSEWTFYPAEKEVNLLPFFTFQVADITQSERRKVELPNKKYVMTKITQVTLVEIPYQNFIENREVVQISIVWLNRAMDTSEN